MVPTFTVQPIDEGGAQLMPRQHRHGYAAVLRRGLPTGRWKSASELAIIVMEMTATRCIPARIRQVGAGTTFTRL
jgi:hypothetical protein